MYTFLLRLEIERIIRMSEFLPKQRDLSYPEYCEVMREIPSNQKGNFGILLLQAMHYFFYLAIHASSARPLEQRTYTIMTSL